MYSIDVYSNFVDWELICGVSTDDVHEALKTANQQSNEGLSVVVMSHKSGCEAYYFPNGIVEIHAGNVHDEEEMEEWF